MQALAGAELWLRRRQPYLAKSQLSGQNRLLHLQGHSKLGIRDDLLQSFLQRCPLSLQLLVLLDVLPANQIHRLSSAAQWEHLTIATSA